MRLYTPDGDPVTIHDINATDEERDQYAHYLARQPHGHVQHTSSSRDPENGQREYERQCYGDAS